MKHCLPLSLTFDYARFSAWLDTEDRERAMKAVKAYMKGQKTRYVDSMWNLHVNNGGKTC